MKTAPSGGGNTDRSLTTTTEKESVMAKASILTLTQRLLLIRSITGHITPATTPEQAEVAHARVEQILAGRDPVAACHSTLAPGYYCADCGTYNPEGGA